MSKSTLSMLLVGGSGEGKSEFILSFINKDHRKKIPASGDGQTTRTSMVYTINREEVPLNICMTIKPKEIFCLDRVNAFMSKFKVEIIGKKRLLDGRKKAFLHNKAFFDVDEFTDSKETIEKKYDELFNEAFFGSIENESDNPDDDSDNRYICGITEDWLKKLGKKEALRSKYYIEDCLTCFSEWMYDTCIAEIDEFLQTNGIELQTGTDSFTDISSLTNKDDSLRRFIKAEKEKPSFSSLVETVRFNTYVAEYYKGIFESIRINSCVFVDTYGLDHTTFPEDVLPKDILGERYRRLFREYPDIDTVIYIRKARSNPPTDLDQNIPPLYMVKPSVMSYIVFTNIDRADDSGKKTIEEMRDPKCDVYDTIVEKLTEENVNDVLSEMRIKCMADNIVEYCSKTETPYFTEHQEHQEQQIEQLKKLFLSIRDEKHLGNSLVNIDIISSNKVKNKLLNVKEIFPNSCFDDDASRTKRALHDRLINGKLGFSSYYQGDYMYWSSEIYSFVMHRFFNVYDILNEDEWKKLLNCKDVVAMVATIQSLLNKFMKFVIRCRKNPSRNLTDNIEDELCKGCDCKEMCIQNIIYKNKKEVIEEPYDKSNPLRDKLRKIYYFGDDSLNQSLEQYFGDLYTISFIPMCRVNNARILASGMNKEMTEQEIEEKIENYYDNYDRNLNEEEKEVFEQWVNQYL